MRRSAKLTLVLAGAVVLTACTFTPDADAPSHAPMASETDGSGKTDLPEPESEQPSSLEAVVTVASVDVDGLNVTASGYVGGVIEDDGTCRFTFTSGASHAEAESAGHADRSTTSCGSVAVARDQLARGSAEVILTYTTADGREVASDPIGLEIP